MKNIKNKKRKTFKKTLILINELLHEDSLVIFLIISLIFPIIFNFYYANLLLKITLIFMQAFSILTLIIWGINFNTIKRQKRFLSYYIPFIFMCISGFISFFDFDLFNYRNLILGCLIIYFMFWGIFNVVRAFLKKTLLSDSLIIVLLSFAFLFLFMSGIYASSNYTELSSTFIKISAGIFYLVAITTLISKHLYSQKKRRIGQTIIDILIGTSIILFSFPYYIQWCGMYGQTFDVFLSVYTAIIGGGLTLIGVAWTIKKTNDEKKLDKRNSIKPILYPISSKSEYNSKQSTKLTFFYKNNTNTKFKVIGTIKNTDNGIFFATMVQINGEEYKSKYPIVLDKNQIAEIGVFINKLEIQKYIYLFGKDVLNNELKYKIVFNKEKNDIESVQEVSS